MSNTDERTFEELAQQMDALIAKKGVDDLFDKGDELEAIQRQVHFMDVVQQIQNQMSEIHLQRKRKVGRLILGLEEEIGAEDKLFVEEIWETDPASAARHGHLALISDKVFQRYVAKCQAERKEVTEKGLLKFDLRVRQRKSKRAKDCCENSRPSGEGPQSKQATRKLVNELLARMAAIHFALQRLREKPMHKLTQKEWGDVIWANQELKEAIETLRALHRTGNG